MELEQLLDVCKVLLIYRESPTPIEDDVLNRRVDDRLPKYLKKVIRLIDASLKGEKEEE